MHFNKLVCVLSLLAAGLKSYAQEKDTTALQEVLIEENRLQMPISHQNRNITIIGSDQIQRLPANNINELLRFVAGVDIRQRGPFGTQADVSLDGGTFEQTLVLVNGAKMLDAQTGHHSLNLPIPTSAIERIEIIRGPAARKYGINSVTGAINIVTKKIENSALVGQVYGGSGFKKDTSNNELFHARGVQLGYRFRREKVQQGIYAGHESGNGYRYNTAFKNHKIWYQGEAQTGKSHQVSLTGGYIYNDFGANGFYAAPGDKESQEIVQTYLLSAGFKHYVSPKFFWNARLNYRQNGDDYRYFRHDLSRARSQHKTFAYNGELNGVLETTLGDLGLGLEARKEEIRSSNIGDHQRNNLGFYGEFQFMEWQHLSVNAGTYINYNTDYGWQWFPGLDLGYQFHPQWKIVAHSGSGHRLPSFTDLYLDQLPGNKGNPWVRPERSWSAEAGVQHSSARVRANAYYFYRDINDFIDWVRLDLADPWVPANFQQNRVQGVSLHVQYVLSDPSERNTWYVASSYTGLVPEIMDSNHKDIRSKYGLQTLKHQWITQISLHSGAWTFTASNRFNQRVSQKQYWLLDTRISYRHQPFLFYLDAQNLSDVTIIEAEAIPLPGRWANLGIQMDLKLN